MKHASNDMAMTANNWQTPGAKNLGRYSNGIIKTNAKTRKRARTARRSTPDLGALNLISKRIHSKAVKMDRPV